VRFAATLLAQKLSERYGLELTVAEEDRLAGSNAIALGEPDAGARTLASLPAPAARPEAYALRVGAGGAAIAAGDRRGLVYGVETLLQMLEESQGRVSAPACLVQDAPRLAFRGVHLFLPARDQLEYTRRLIRTCWYPCA